MGKQLYHPECYVQVKTLWHKEREPVRWQSHPPEDQQAILERGHAHTRHWQAETQARATRSFKKWKPWEDEVIMAVDAEPDHIIALDLGRSLEAVRRRRHQLKRRSGI